jgi:S-adenosylhomocysteine hydrolase
MRSKLIGIVEQTQKGANIDKEITNLSAPVLNVAESTFKKMYESPEIGRVTVQNIGKFTPNTKLSGQHAVIFGFGSVGQEVAFHLTNFFNMTVSVVDRDDFAVLRARHKKSIVSEAAKTFKDLDFGNRAVLAVGTTGGKSPSITEEVLKSLPNGAIVVSTSSDREEIDMVGLERMSAGRHRRIELGKDEYLIDAPDGRTKSIILLAEGYPINFYATESLPNDTIDPIMTLLLLAGVELAINRDKPLEANLNAKAVDRITDDRRLIQRFMQNVQ